MSLGTCQARGATGLHPFRFNMSYSDKYSATSISVRVGKLSEIPLSGSPSMALPKATYNVRSSNESVISLSKLAKFFAVWGCFVVRHNSPFYPDVWVPL